MIRKIQKCIVLVKKIENKKLNIKIVKNKAFFNINNNSNNNNNNLIKFNNNINKYNNINNSK